MIVFSLFCYNIQVKHFYSIKLLFVTFTVQRSCFKRHQDVSTSSGISVDSFFKFWVFSGRPDHYVNCFLMALLKGGCPSHPSTPVQMITVGWQWWHLSQHRVIIMLLIKWREGANFFLMQSGRQAFLSVSLIALRVDWGLSSALKVTHTLWDLLVRREVFMSATFLPCIKVSHVMLEKSITGVRYCTE